MKRFILLLPASLIACAVPYEAQQARARESSNDQLCYVSVAQPEYSRAANEELTRRGASCDWQKVQLMMQAGSRNYTPPPQQILLQAPQSNQVTCTHQSMGGGMVRSDCR